MEELKLICYTSDESNWISRGDERINIRAYTFLRKEEDIEWLEILKKVIKIYDKEKSEGRNFSFEMFANCLDYYGIDVEIYNQSELEENYNILINNIEDFYIELELKDGESLNAFYVRFICNKKTNIIYSENGILNGIFKLKSFKVYDENNMKACIRVRKNKKFENKKEYFILQQIFYRCDKYSITDLIKSIEEDYNYKMVFSKVYPKYEEAYNHLIKNSIDYEIKPTLIESDFEAILKINFNLKTVI